MYTFLAIVVLLGLLGVCLLQLQKLGMIDLPTTKLPSETKDEPKSDE